MNLKHLIAVVAVVASSLVACQKGATAADNADKHKSDSEHATLTSSSDMLAAAELFASDKGRRWDAYSSLPQIKWIDASRKQYGSGRYSRAGKILLVGFSVKDIPNGRPGLDFEVIRRNEGKSTLSISGSQSEVDSISISKPLYSDNYLSILKQQFGAKALISTIAEKCSAGEFEEGAGEGAFFAVSLTGQGTIYVQASQEEGGKYTAGYTVFKLTRNRPSEVIAELNCKRTS